jgi:hypothetical protein
VAPARKVVAAEAVEDKDEEEDDGDMSVGGCGSRCLLILGTGILFWDVGCVVGGQRKADAKTAEIESKNQKRLWFAAHENLDGRWCEGQTCGRKTATRTDFWVEDEVKKTIAEISCCFFLLL